MQLKAQKIVTRHSNLLSSNCITFCGIPSPCFSSLRIPWYTLDISEVVELSIQSTADWERVWRSLILRINLAAYQCWGSCSIPSEWKQDETIYPYTHVPIYPYTHVSDNISVHEVLIQMSQIYKIWLTGFTVAFFWMVLSSYWIAPSSSPTQLVALSLQPL